MDIAGMGPVSEFVAKRIEALLDERRVVVWYDGERAFKDVAAGFSASLAAQMVVIVVSDSRLRARRAADAAYGKIGREGGPTALLVYVPEARASDDRMRQGDPFELYARMGEAFGDNEGEQLRALAGLALPRQAAALERIFAEGAPTLASVDALPATEDGGSPLVRTVLGTEEPVEVIVRVLSQRGALERLSETPGAESELRQLIETAIGLAGSGKESFKAYRERLATYVLVSDLADDIELPAAIANVAHASGTSKELVIESVARLRESDAGRDAYVALAREVEQKYGIAHALSGTKALGRRDTFPCQDVLRAQVIGHLAATDLRGARALLAANGSVWRNDEGRIRTWSTIERGIEFLEVAERLALKKAKLPEAPRELVERYAAADGLCRLDSAQRKFEQAAAECGHNEEIEGLVALCRERYREQAGAVQEAFQEAVRQAHWPPDGIRRQTQTFNDRVAPELEHRQKVVYFLVDSLRFEMGRDLAGALAGLGSVEVEAAAAALPTITSNGMAALLPGADGALQLVPQGGELVPALGSTLLPGLKERQAVMKTKLGDRYADIELGKIFETTPKNLAKSIGDVDLLVVRSLDIDDRGEGRSAYNARKLIGGTVGDLKAATERLVGLGFSVFIYAADHGHVLIPELPAGDVVPIPEGDWLLKKRRSVIGKHHGTVKGVVLVPATQVGIQSSVDELEYAAASGFMAFRDAGGYFHEGLSLQECLIPVVRLRATTQVGSPTGGGEQVTITYRSNQFSGGVVGLKVLLTSMFSPTLVVRIEAFDGSGPKAKRVGEASDCDAWDPATGEVTLVSGVETQVPLSIDFDFIGPSIEVRASDPRTGVVYGTLKLKNGRLD